MNLFRSFTQIQKNFRQEKQIEHSGLRESRGKANTEYHESAPNAEIYII